jgi:hypothetical protein
MMTTYTRYQPSYGPAGEPYSVRARYAGSIIVSHYWTEAEAMDARDAAFDAGAVAVHVAGLPFHGAAVVPQALNMIVICLDNHKFSHRRKTPMARGDSGATSARWSRWPFHSAYFWCGLLAGVGIGLLLGAALVELELLTSQRKAWVSLLGAVLVGVGGLISWRGQSGNRGGAEPDAAPDRGHM